MGLRFIYLAFFILFVSLAARASDYLYIGDSHSAFSSQVTEFSKVFVSGVEASGKTLAFYAAGGSSLLTWNSGGKVVWGYTEYTAATGRFMWRNLSSAPSLASLIVQHRPTEMIVHLGDNMLSEKNYRRVVMAPMPSYHEDSIRKFLAALPSGMKCTWIGPTYHPPGSAYLKPDAVVDDFYARLNNLFLQPDGRSRCAMIDTRQANLAFETGDGLHHTSAISKVLGQFVLHEWKAQHP